MQTRYGRARQFCRSQVRKRTTFYGDCICLLCGLFSGYTVAGAKSECSPTRWPPQATRFWPKSSLSVVVI
jgi:hypothetical protein